MSDYEGKESFKIFIVLASFSLQVLENHSQPPSPQSPCSPKYPDHVLNKPDNAMFPDKPDTTSSSHNRREPAFKRTKVGSELKQIFETKVKPLLRRESAEQFDLEIHSPKGNGEFQENCESHQSSISVLL